MRLACVSLLIGLRSTASLRDIGSPAVVQGRRRVSEVAMLLKPCWEEVGDCQVLRPVAKPRALLHFLGGVFVSPAPQVAYKYMLESLADRGYLVVATPFAVDFNYRKPAAEVYERFTVRWWELELMPAQSQRSLLYVASPPAAAVGTAHAH